MSDLSGPGQRRRRPGAHAAPPRFRPSWWILAVSLALVNVFLLVANVVKIRAKGHFTDRRWAGHLDGSYSELLGHVTLLAAAVVLIIIWRERHSTAHGVWALVLGFLVADDFLLLHEHFGGLLARTVGLPSVIGLRPQDLGELLAWAGPMAVLGSAVLITHVRARGFARRHSWTLLALMAALAGFAVVVDMAPFVLKPWLSTREYVALTLTETAGELGVMTLFLIAAQHMLQSRNDHGRRRPPTSIVQRGHRRPELIR
ncbi:hypothetical protein [Actinoplanes sp. G11-F43]|uniref:hypothetical protein n=1 Tax=Actinoplanes sp. G11-F43 TaxID=3424130 RepID=UPI003D328FAF